MDNLDLFWLIPAAVLILVAALLLRRRNKPGPQAADAAPGTLAPVAIPLRLTSEEEPDTRSTSIVIGTTLDAPMLTIRPVSSLTEFGPVQPIDVRSG